jgi:hypothetical protein
MTLFRFESNKKPSNFPPPVGYDTNYNGEKKKRTSITNFFHPPSITLKRKHEDDLQDQQEQENKRKKTAVAAAAAVSNMKNHMGTMSRLFQRIAVTVNKSTRSSTPRKDPQPEFIDVFQTLKLPTIEWTNGSLGILPSQTPHIVEPAKENAQLKQHQAEHQAEHQVEHQAEHQEENQEEDSVFCINNTEFMEFPVPPLLKTIPKRSIRKDSCPPRFNSLVIIEEETSSDDDDEFMPSTPSSDPILYDESNNKIELLGLS